MYKYILYYYLMELIVINDININNKYENSI